MPTMWIAHPGNRSGYEAWIGPVGIFALRETLP